MGVKNTGKEKIQNMIPVMTEKAYIKNVLYKE